MDRAGGGRSFFHPDRRNLTGLDLSFGRGFGHNPLELDQPPRWKMRKISPKKAKVSGKKSRHEARSQMNHIVSIQNVYKDYPLDKVVVQALRGVSLSVEQGDFLSIVGPSGSGKTTLLNLIGCVDTATKGTVLIDGHDTKSLNHHHLTDLRLNTLGFIFQSFNLVPVLSVFQNVEFPLLLHRKFTKEERAQRVNDLLKKVGLYKHSLHRPT